MKATLRSAGLLCLAVGTDFVLTKENVPQNASEFNTTTRATAASRRCWRELTSDLLPIP